MQEISEMLRFARKYENLSQEQLAEKAGVSLATVKNVELGKQSPKWVIVEACIEACGFEFTLTRKE